MAMRGALIAFFILLAGNARTLPLENESSSAPKNEELPVASYRLSGIAVPVHYDIKLIPYLEEDNFTFDGETWVRLNVREKTQTLDFHAKDLTFDEEDAYLEDENDQRYKAIDFAYVNASEIMTITLDKVMPPGLYTFHVKFIGILNDKLFGFYRSSYTNDNGKPVWLATTQFEATSARVAFPCWDEPSFKATFNVSIKHSTNYTALSNMPAYERSMIDEVDGKVWTHFQKTPVMSTYTLAFVVADYVHYSNADGTINIWTRENAVASTKYAYEIAKKASVLLEEYANSSVRVPKMDHVSIPDLPHGAMENWGLITYSEESFLYDPQKNSPLDKTYTTMMVAHELSHQWFGNVVSPTWWNHLWLNEGFATFFQQYINDKIFPDWRLMETFGIRLQYMAFSFDTPPCESIDRNLSKPNDIEDSFSGLLYTKTPCLVRMLWHIVTDDVFRQGLVNYLRAYQYGIAEPDDLWREIQNVVDETPEIPRGEFRVKEMMDTWIYQRNYPLVTVERNYDTGEVTISQEIFQASFGSKDNGSTADENDASKRSKWWIPINYATRTNANFSSTLPSHWLNPKNETITISGIDADDWIILNVQQTGYYRINYDERNWMKLAEYLNSPDYEKIPVANRVQIIQDAYKMMITKRMNVTVFFELFNYLSRETDYYGWCQVFEMFTDVVGLWLETTEGHRLIQPYLLDLMGGIIGSISFDWDESGDHVTQITKLHVRKWACMLDHPECKKKSYEDLLKILNHSDKAKYPTYLKEWVYCSGLLNSEELTWDKFLDLYETEGTAILQHLYCIRNLTIIENLLNMTIAENSSFSLDGKKNIFEGLIYAGSDVTDAVVDFIKKNWEDHGMRDVPTILLSGTMVLSATSMHKLEEIKSFLEGKNVEIPVNVKEREEFLREAKNILGEFRAWMNKKKNVGSKDPSPI